MSQNPLALSTTGPLPGLTAVQGINNGLDSLSRMLSGPAAPTATGLGLADLKGVVWHDTSANLLKVRDQADSAWIVIGSFDEANKLFRAAAGAQPVTAIAVNQAITAASHGANLVATAALTLTLPQASSLANGACAFAILAEGGAVTLVPNAADSIVAGSSARAAGLTYILPQGDSAVVTGDGAGRWYLFSLTQQSNVSVAVPTRQTVLSGVTDANGRAAFVTTGSGLQPGLLATASPLVLAFAHGFGASGAIDYVEEIGLDDPAFFPSLPANTMSYLYAQRDGVGNVVGGATPAPVQYGQTYNRAAQASLSLNNNVVDDFGNAWVNSGVTFSNSSPKIAGTYYGVFNGASASLKSSNFSTISSFGNGGWSLRAWVNPAVLPSSGGYMVITRAGNASNYGADLGLYNNSGNLKFIYNLSSAGSSFDIASNVSGVTTPVAGSWYFVELTYDPVAGGYYLYVNGNLEASTASSSKVCPITQLYVGQTGSGYYYWNGSMQGFEFLPYCQHPGGTTYSVPTALPDVTAAGYASGWFDTSTMQMKRVSAPSTVAGANPSFTVVDRVYLGEVTAAQASLLSLNNSFADDFGNSWQQQNVTFDNASPMISGAYYGVFNGSSSLALLPWPNLNGQNGWTIRMKYTPNALPGTAGANSPIFHGSYGTGPWAGTPYGIFLGMYNTDGAGHVRFGFWLSSNNSSWDIASCAYGPTDIVRLSSYDIELTFDAAASTYRLYVNGVQEATITSSGRIGRLVQFLLAKQPSGGWGSCNIQGLEFLPYCLHPGGMSFVPPTAFDTTANVLSRGSLLGSVTSYAYRGVASGSQENVAKASVYSFAHNIGVADLDVDLWMECRQPINGHQPGDRFGISWNGNYGTGGTQYGTFWQTTSKSLLLSTGVTAMSAIDGGVLNQESNWRLGWSLKRRGF